MEGCEKDLEFALSASFIGPQSHHTHRRCQHDIVGHRGAELILQVLNWAAAIVDGNKVPLALIWVVHLILQETHVDLRGVKKRVSEFLVYTYFTNFKVFFFYFEIFLKGFSQSTAYSSIYQFSQKSSKGKRSRKHPNWMPVPPRWLLLTQRSSNSSPLSLDVHAPHPIWTFSGACIHDVILLVTSQSLWIQMRVINQKLWLRIQLPVQHPYYCCCHTKNPDHLPFHFPITWQQQTKIFSV